MPNAHAKKKKAPKGKTAELVVAHSAPVKAPGMHYATFWQRVVAHIIDMLIVVAISTIAATISFTATVGFPMMHRMWGHPAGWIVGWLYFALMESSKEQATFGKMIMRIRVTGLRGQRITFARATARFFSKIISGAAFGLGFLMMLFTERKQALHDLIADTLVLKNEKRG